MLSSYGFDSSMTLTLLQGVVTIVALTTMKRLRYIDYPAFEWGVARKVAPLSFVFIAYVVISLIRCAGVPPPPPLSTLVAQRGVGPTSPRGASGGGRACACGAEPVVHI